MLKFCGGLAILFDLIWIERETEKEGKRVGTKKGGMEGRRQRKGGEEVGERRGGEEEGGKKGETVSRF